MAVALLRDEELCMKDSKFEESPDGFFVVSIAEVPQNSTLNQQDLEREKRTNRRWDQKVVKLRMRTHD